MTVHPTRQQQEWEAGDARVTRTHHERGTTITLSGPDGAVVAISQEIADAINAALAWTDPITTPPIPTRRWDTPQVEVDDTTAVHATGEWQPAQPPFARPTEPTWKDLP